MRETARTGWLWHWGKWMYRWRHGVLIIWTLLFAMASILAIQVPSMLKDNGFTPTGSESYVGYELLRDGLGLSSTTMDIVYESSDGRSLLTKESIQQIERSLTELKQNSSVGDVQLRTQDRTGVRSDVVAAHVRLNMDTDEALDRYTDLRKLISDIPFAKAYVTGATPIYYDIQTASKNDIVKSELIGLPIALIVLLFVFGTWLAGFLPLIIGLFSVTTTLGIIYGIAQLTDTLSNFLPNMVSMLGLAVGIDYALFIVSRFREELAKQFSVEQAVAMTAQTAGQSILFSGVAVLIGLIAMLFIDLSLFRSLCIGGVIVVMMSVIAGNTLLLSLLSVLGDKVNKFPIIPARWRSAEKASGSELWSRIAHGVMKHPVGIVLLLTTALAACAWPIGSMKIGIPDAEMLPPKYESRYGAELMREAYDEQALNPIQIVVETDKPYSSIETIQAIQGLASRIQLIEGVQRVDSYVDALAQLNITGAEAQAAALSRPEVRTQMEAKMPLRDKMLVVQVILRPDMKGDAAFKVVGELRQIDSGSGLSRKYVTGGPAVQHDIIERITTALPYVIAFILIVTYIVLFLAFRSVLLPLKAVIMNMLSLGASLGIVVLVFQHGYLADLLHVTSTGMVVAMLPVIIFCVVFGISMDYEVFLLSRIAEEYDRTKDNEHSTAQGLMKTGSIITSAAFILIVVVGAFIFTDNEMMKAIGLGLAVSVFLDATLIRVLLVPAFMKLMGHANWWVPSMFRRKERRSML